jgi:hypothetical protein
MFDPLSFPVPSPDFPTLVPPADLGPLLDLACKVTPAAWLYLVAAIVARFWHRHMWVIYLGLALDTILVPHP